MKFTMITEKNARCFEAAIGELFREQRRDRLFFGVIDEAEEAAGAAAFTIGNSVLWIDRIGVEDKKRRKGYGSFLLRESIQFARQNGFEWVCASFYETEENVSSNELVSFLSACGFRLERTPIERKVYRIEDLVKKEEPLFPTEAKDYVFYRGWDLPEEQKEELIRLSVNEKGGFSYLDEDLLFSEENRYGGVVLKDGVPLASAAVLPFGNGVRFDQLFGSLENIGALRFLLGHVLQEIKKEPYRKELYLDVGGEKLIALQTELFQRAAIACKSTMQGFAARKGTGEA
ncbi:MAG: GNAT family N-acetyltransferase [Lachnospiraceae bacterium]|nr:GNAT family N-acetyltransferase [Lachnospiraceae bacterium]